MRFSDGCALHRGSPTPGATAFTLDLQGRSMDQVTAFDIAARDLFGNEYAIGYQR